MNGGCGNNYLLVQNTENTTEDLFKLAIKFAEQCETVLYLSPKPLNKLPDIGKPEKEVLKRIIFMYYDTIYLLTEKLLELQTWSIAPRLIIIDSLHNFTLNCSREMEIEKYVLTIASLFNCMQFLRRRLNGECTSVISVDINKSNVDWQLLVDLYYYKTAICDVSNVI